MGDVEQQDTTGPWPDVVQYVTCRGTVDEAVHDFPPYDGRTYELVVHDIARYEMLARSGLLYRRPSGQEGVAAYWRRILEIDAGEPTRDEVHQAFNRLAQIHHPDHGGTKERMAELYDAREAAMRELNRRD